MYLFVHTHTDILTQMYYITQKQCLAYSKCYMQVLDIIIFKRYFSCKPPLVPTRRQRESLKYSFILKLAQDQYWIWSFKYARMSWGPLFCFCSFVLGYLKKAQRLKSLDISFKKKQEKKRLCEERERLKLWTGSRALKKNKLSVSTEDRH